MTSVILRTASRLLMTFLLLLSIFLLLRGHNQPGGGFIGGLVGASAFALYTIAYNVRAAREAFRLEPNTLIGIGLSLAVLSGLVAAFVGDAFLTGLWLKFDLAGTEIKLGTPLFFDIGVYFVVIGVTLTMIFALEEEQ